MSHSSTAWHSENSEQYFCSETTTCCWLFWRWHPHGGSKTVYIYSKVFSCVWHWCFISCSLMGSLFMFQLWCVVSCGFQGDVDRIRTVKRHPPFTRYSTRRTVNYLSESESETNQCLWMVYAVFGLISDTESKTFIWVELHKPLVFPLLEPVKIILQNCWVSVVMDSCV